jgi:hypothetical protein
MFGYHTDKTSCSLHPWDAAHHQKRVARRLQMLGSALGFIAIGLMACGRSCFACIDRWAEDVALPLTSLTSSTSVPWHRGTHVITWLTRATADK